MIHGGGKKQLADIPNSSVVFACSLYIVPSVEILSETRGHSQRMGDTCR